MNNIITEDMFFNDETVNIFTDASIIKTISGETIGCAGNNIIIGNTIMGQPRMIIRNSTNNNSEITAIYMAVINALMYKNIYKCINIFSDSKICIFGLREWIYNWIKNSTPDGILISSQGKPVANQDIILRIIYFIIDHDLHVNFYHINGHVNVNNPDQLLSARETFKTSNNIKHEVDLELIRKIEIANDAVDNFTRNQLNECVFENVEQQSTFINYSCTGIDIEKYSKLIGGK